MTALFFLPSRRIVLQHNDKTFHGRKLIKFLNLLSKPIIKAKCQHRNSSYRHGIILHVTWMAATESEFWSCRIKGVAMMVQALGIEEEIEERGQGNCEHEHW